MGLAQVMYAAVRKCFQFVAKIDKQSALRMSFGSEFLTSVFYDVNMIRICARVQ